MGLYGWKTWNSFLTRVLISPRPGIQDEAEAEDEDGSAAPHRQVPTGRHLSTCEIGVFGLPQRKAGAQ